MKFNRELLKGHLSTIILATIYEEPCHAYGLSKKVEDLSLGVFSLAEGTVYPSLHKLEKDGLIKSEWSSREKGPDVKLYHITDKGKKQLEEKRREWKFFSRAMNMVLQCN